MGILETVLRRREPAAAYRTIDGGHPAPYPDMTDEQLYNYELAFNVPKRTFDRPPSSRRVTGYGSRLEPEFEPVSTAFHATQEQVRASGKAFETASHAPAPEWHGAHAHGAFEPSPIQAGVPPATDEIPQPDAHDDSEEMPELFAEANAWKVAPNPRTSGDSRPLDLSKPVRTITTKQPVEIITTKARHPVYKVQGYIGNDQVVTVFTLDGQLSEHGARFLENMPEQQELYLNIYPNQSGCGNDRYVITQHETREEADAAAGAGRIACVKAELG